MSACTNVNHNSANCAEAEVVGEVFEGWCDNCCQAFEDGKSFGDTVAYLHNNGNPGYDPRGEMAEQSRTNPLATVWFKGFQEGVTEGEETYG